MLLLLVPAAVGLTWAAIVFGRHVGLVDTPSGRKSHVGEVPLVGGIAIFLNIILGTFALDIQPFTYQMLAIAAIVFGIGVYDDLSHLNPHPAAAHTV